MRESLGFRIVIIASIIYIVGFAFSIAVDIKPRKEILLRLMKDLMMIIDLSQDMQVDFKLHIVDPSIIVSPLYNLPIGSW